MKNSKKSVKKPKKAVVPNPKPIDLPTPQSASANPDEQASLVSVDRLQADLLKYRKRCKYLEKQIFHLSKEYELIKKIETGLKQAYDYSKEAERELSKFARPTKKKTTTKMFPNKCCECLQDFMASWKGRKHCDDCIQKNPRARAAQRTRKLALAN
jgi:hypothetical protein